MDPNQVWTIYASGLVVNFMFMSIGLVHIMSKYAMFWKDLKLTSTDDILAATGVRIEDDKISKQNKTRIF